MLEIEPFRVGLRRPLRTADGAIEFREGLLVRVDYREETGVGEATPLPGWTESIEECRESLARASEVAEHLDWGIALAKVPTPAARHGLSLALADARARAESVPLYRSLGATDRVPSVPVNATIGDEPVEHTVERARDAVDSGFDAVKLKVGARSVADDVERVRAVREAVGDGVELRADANGAWTPEQAERFLDDLGDVLDVVEQPLASDDLSGHADLRDGDVDVALDESVRDVGPDRVLASDAADVIVCKPMVVGGPDRARSVALDAIDRGVDPVITTTIDAVVARTAAVHVAASIPEVRACGLATGDLLRTDLFEDPAPVHDGHVLVPQDKGLGLPARPGS